MGKKRKTDGTSAGGKTKYKDTGTKNQMPDSDSLEESLQKRSRFATDHLRHLEALYREGLNLEEELLEDEKLSDEELQGALDELESMGGVQSAAEQVQETEFAVAQQKENKTAAAETVAEEEAFAEAVSEKMLSEGIALEKLTDANVTLEELAEAGITAESFPAEEAETGKELSGDGSLSEADASESEDASELDASESEDASELDASESEDAPEADASESEDAPEADASESEDAPEADASESEDVPEADASESEDAPEADASESEDVPEAEAFGNAGNDGNAGNGGAQASLDSRRKSGLSKKTGMIQIVVFFVALFGISIVGFCMPLRPTESQIEKRTLTEFPEFTWESFLSGDYTDQISTWYADTFPFRETLLSWYTDFKKLFGIQGTEVYIGDVIVADDIPDIPEEDETTQATATDATATDATEETTAEPQTETTTEAQTETTTAEPTDTATEIQTTTSGSSGSNVVGEQIGSVYIYGDQAFSVYGFSLEMSDNYAKMISLAAEELAGKATVYNILVPLSYGIQLDSSVWESMGWSDEEKAIKYMYSQMSDNVKTVSVYQALLEHKDEYIYFRTDHHWTALGAYYAYQCFASAKGITANALDSFETMTFENYLGSLYSQSNESEALANNPDTITAYVPHGTNRMTITQKDGSILDWRVIYDVTTWRNDSKYSCFIGGDNPFSVIENPEITDGSSVLLVKESFGNAFAPFLVDHYQYVYVIDFRYYSGHLEDVVDTYGIQDVIFMNNLNSAGGSLQNYLQSFIEPEEETGSGE